MSDIDVTAGIADRGRDLRIQGQIIPPVGTTVGNVLTATATGSSWQAGASSGAVTLLFHSQLAADASGIDTGAGGIATTSTHLRVVCRGRTDEAAVLSLALIRVNGDAGANYDRAGIDWNGAAVAFVSSYGSTSWLFDCLGNTADANRFTVMTLDLIDYTDTSSFKQGMSNAGEIGTAANANVRLTAGRFLTYKSTSAVTQLAYNHSNGTVLKAGSSLTIYGLQ
jgi:hypothetical protein